MDKVFDEMGGCLLAWEMIIWVPPWRKRARRPTLSAVMTATKVEKTLTRPVMTEETREASWRKPTVLKRTGA
uniref:Uncharacterized protein n=5 Tax=Oryza TaxID=4527 RepID=A0A0D3F108_9ORYZ